MSEARTKWFTKLLEAGIENEIFAAPHVLEYVTPEVLAKHVPPALMSKVLAAALSSSSMTPEIVMETLSPQLLAEHIPHDILWECVSAAADKAEIAESSKGS